MNRYSTALRTAVCLSVFGSTLSVTPHLMAKDPEGSPAANRRDESAKPGELPACLKKLNLSDDQKTKATEIVRKYDEKTDRVVKQFSDRYLETIRTEVALLTAIEDHLSDTQRDGLRSQRHKAAHSDKDADHSDAATRGDRNPGQADSRTKQNNDDSGRTAVKTNPQDRNSAVVIEQVDEIVVGNGVTLTVEQEAIADQITNKHVRHLRSLHRHIHAIHNRLIALEADKLAELEKLLTKDQLKQLREERQSVGDDHRVSSTSSKTTGE